MTDRFAILEGGPLDGNERPSPLREGDDWLKLDYILDGQKRDVWYRRTERTVARDGRTLVVFQHVQKGS